MTQRYCPVCASEVEDLGGYCRLGHRLKLDSPQASLTELRDEVDRAFEDARLAPEHALVGVAAAPERPTVVPNPAQPAPPQAPSAGPRSRPNLPPTDDPIAAFAPPPRMDWGPERPWRVRLSRLTSAGRRSRPS